MPAAAPWAGAIRQRQRDASWVRRPRLCTTLAWPGLAGPGRAWRENAFFALAPGAAAGIDAGGRLPAV